MKKIVLVKTDEGLFDYNRNLAFENIKDKEIEIQLHTEMVFKSEVDIVYFQMYVRYMLDKEQVISYSISLGFKVTDWSILIKDMKDEDVLKTDEVYRMAAITVGFLRGSLSLQERNTPFKGAFLPLVDIKALIKDISINRLEDEKVRKGG